MRLLGSLAGVALAVAALAGPAGGAATAGPDAGWWSRTNVGLPADPGVPPDVGPTDLYVAGGGSSGASVDDAVAAVRAAVPAGAGVRSLRLAIKGNPPTSSTVKACAATSDWKPAQGGPYTAAPTSDCAKAVTGAVVGSDLVFDNIGGLVAPGGTAISLVLLPGAADRVVLAKPTASAFDIAPVTPAPDVGPAPTDSGTAPSAPPAPDASSVPAPVAPSGPELAAPAPAPAILAPDLASPPARPLPAPPTGASPTGLAPSLPLGATTARPADDRVRSGAALLMILLLAGYTAVDHLRPRRGPRPIGPFARAAAAPVAPGGDDSPNERGVGRFRRSREGQLARL